MSLDSHISSLKQKHARLEDRISELANHPSADPAEVSQLKKEKLAVKDLIEARSVH